MEANLKIDHAVVDGAGQIVDITVNGQNLTAGAEIQNNKNATINVANYTDPVEIKPATGKDAMKKVTVTLEDIPSGGSGTIYAWYNGSGIMYFSFDEAPADQAAFDAEKAVAMNGGVITTPELSTLNFTYTKVSDSEFTIESEGTTLTLTRVSANDVTIW